MNLDIVILEGPQAGRRIPVSTETVSFGRSPKATASFPEDSFMSGMHLEAHLAPGGVKLVDRHSTNGSFLNGRRIPEAIAVLGDTIKIGSLTLQIVDRDMLSGEFITPIQIGLTATIAMPPVEAPPPRVPEPLLSVLRKPGTPLYCLLDAAANDMMPSLMLLAQDRHELLSDDGPGATHSMSAPYLVEFSAESVLLEILADKGWGNEWVSYFNSAASFEEIAVHFRNFLAVQLAERGDASFCFYNPRTMRDFLSTAGKGEAATFFGVVTRWLLEGESKSVLLEMREGDDGVEVEDVPLSDQ